MKNILILSLFVILFTNCTHKIVRSGYVTDKSGYTSSEIHIKKFTNIPDSIATKIGEVKLNDTGMAVSCSEEHAINILREEALELNADLIVITDEIRPDLWSSCYRCSANFYRFSKAEYANYYNSDPTYQGINVNNRVEKDRNKNTSIIMGSVAAGILLGFLMVM